MPEHGDVRTCGPEDLVVLKAIANRAQDWIDIENTFVRQGRKLDVRLILTELEPLIEWKEEPEILAGIQRLLV